MRTQTLILALFLALCPLTLRAADAVDSSADPEPFNQSAVEITALLQNPQLAARLPDGAQIDAIERGDTSRSGTKYRIRAGACTASMRATWLGDGKRADQVRTFVDDVSCE